MASLQERYSEVRKKAVFHNSSMQSHQKRLEEAERELSEEIAKLKELQDSSILLDSCFTILKSIVEKSGQQHLEQIRNLLNYGVKMIYYNRQYSFDFEIEDKRDSKTVEIFLVEHLIGDEGTEQVIKSAIRDEIGGGVRAVIGTLLQIFYLQYFKLAPIIFLDESFSEVSSEYLPGLFQFLGGLSDKIGLRIVLITHDDRMLPYANRVYVVNKGVVTQRPMQGVKV